MIVKSENLLLFEHDALKIEYITGLNYSYYIIAYKNSQKFFIQSIEFAKKFKE